VAVALSIALILTRTARPHDAILGQVDDLDGWHSVERYRDSRTVRGLVIYRFDAPLFFANAEYFRHRVLEVVDADPHIEWFLLDAEAISLIDSSGVAVVDELARELAQRGISFAVARARDRLREMLDRTGIADLIGRDRFYPTTREAVAAFRDRP
jgi:anti-anti-sigma factor